MIGGSVGVPDWVAQAWASTPPRRYSRAQLVDERGAPVRGRDLEVHRVTAVALGPLPIPGLECYDEARAPEGWTDVQVKLPKLFRIYLRHGALVCGPPAIDREFKTIDYLVLFDVNAMSERQIRTFFG